MPLERVVSLVSIYTVNQPKPKGQNMNYYDLTQSIREAKAERYLAKKRYERNQRYINIFLTLSISFIASVTIATGLIMWIEALT